MSPPPGVSVVLPCLNEAESLSACIAEARRGLDAAGLPGEILVVDNGSDDGSPAIALRAGAEVRVAAERGYGAALRTGIAAARGDWIVIADADGSYDLSALGDFVAELERGADVVVGCRFPSGGGRILPGAMPWKNRWIGNPALSFLGRRLFGVAVRDFHCGMRALSRDAGRRMRLRSTGMELASEMIVQAALAGLRISEVPVTLRPDGRSRAPHLRPYRDGWRHLRLLLLLSPLWLFFAPGAVVTALGALVGLRLLFGPWEIGPVTLDTNSLAASALAILVGTELLWFGLFTRTVATIAGYLPRSRRLAALYDIFTLERGLAAGGASILLGLGLFAGVLWDWSATSFGALPRAESTRQMILALLFVLLGVQALFASFVLSLLGMAHDDGREGGDRS